jgi:hypothetical protein
MHGVGNQYILILLRFARVYRYMVWRCEVHLPSRPVFETADLFETLLDVFPNRPPLGLFYEPVFSEAVPRVNYM